MLLIRRLVSSENMLLFFGLIRGGDGNKSSRGGCIVQHEPLNFVEARRRESQISHDVADMCIYLNVLFMWKGRGGSHMKLNG